MNTELFVQNIKTRCKELGISPTVACRESGVGTSFINNIEKRGTLPSVGKVQDLAIYLGVTTSQLLGESNLEQQKNSFSTISDEEAVLNDELIERLCQLSPEQRAHVDAFLKGLLASD